MFSNKVAIVTGAGSGIGKAVSAALYRQGASLVMLGTTEAKLKNCAEELGGGSDRIRYFACSVVDEEALQAVKMAILRDWSQIDILVTCAAAPAASSPLELQTMESWRSLLSTDLDGVFLSCKTFGSAMLSRKYGRIVNLTSFHNVGTYPNRVAYNAAKSGVEGLTRALAVEWGRQGITVNAVAPGPIRTPRTSTFLAESPDVEKGMLGRTPTCRLGEVEDVANTVCFLASDLARHINGQQIVLDGGWTKSAWWGEHKKAYE